MAARATHPNLDAERRAMVAAGQRPFATVLASADSRVAPELIFDQGLGDLFVTRVAGNVLDDAILASIEYSVIHLGSTLVMALGHERCGAVKSTVDALAGHGSEEDRGTKIGVLAALIAPPSRPFPPARWTGSTRRSPSTPPTPPPRSSPAAAAAGPGVGRQAQDRRRPLRPR